MKKQALYTPDTPIKASAQAAGYLREDFRDLDHEESWILLLNGAHLPLAKKMITVGTIKSTQIDHRRIIKEALLCNAEPSSRRRSTTGASSRKRSSATQPRSSSSTTTRAGIPPRVPLT